MLSWWVHIFVIENQALVQLVLKMFSMKCGVKLRRHVQVLHISPHNKSLIMLWMQTCQNFLINWLPTQRLKANAEYMSKKRNCCAKLYTNWEEQVYQKVKNTEKTLRLWLDRLIQIWCLCLMDDLRDCLLILLSNLFKLDLNNLWL